jgi:hypothetical protein
MHHTITLYRTSQGWMSRTTEPEVRELFGTDTLPTAFTAQAAPATVLARIQALNPDCHVELHAAQRHGK